MIRLASKMGLTIRSHRRTSSTRAVVFAATLFLCLFHLTKSEGQSCGPGWCNTFPVSGSLSGRQTPPFGSSAWNKLTYVPDADRFFIFSSDGIWTFSNAWWSYGVMGHVAASNPWIEESTSGTIQSTVTDNSKGFLKAAIGSADTVITLEKGEGATFHPDPDHGGVLVIDDEEIGYTSAGRSEDKFTEVRRGIRGTTAASHTARTLVNAGAPAPQSRIQGKLIAVNDHIPDRHPFLTSTYDSRRHQLFQAGGILEGNKKTDTWYFCFVENEFCPKGDVRVWKRLLTKKDELERQVVQSEQEGRESDQEGTQDPADKAFNAYTKEFLFLQSGDNRRILQLVNDALDRIRDGTYGLCVACEQEVQAKRLEAVPWARHCIECQEKQEQGLL